MNKLQKQRIIDPAGLDGQNYLQSLLHEGQRTGLLGQAGLKKIQAQLLELLAFEAARYTHGESSSVRIETAESILKSVSFTLSLFLKTLPPEEGIAYLTDKPLKELLSEGRKLIKKKFRIAKLNYLESRASAVKTANLAYNETMEGIAVFFGAYDMEFGAHEAPAMIDYPLSGEPIGSEGIEYILEYTKRLLTENRYLNRFSPGQIHFAMLRYDPGYADLLVNIYEQVLKCVSPDGTLPQPPLEKSKNTVQFTDGKKLEDEELRDLIKELGDCRLPSDKSRLILSRIRSFMDLKDILSSGCLFGAEFGAIFRSLEEPQLALLLLETADGDRLHAAEYEREWQEAFLRFFSALEPERRAKIHLLSKEIGLPEYFSDILI